MDKEQILSKVNEVLERHEIEKPVVDVFRIAKEEGVKLNFLKMPEELKDVAGFFDYENKAIFVNNDDHPKRQMFTVAHELGHYILSHDKNELGVLYRMQKFSGDRELAEQEANFFAAYLLVPKKMLLDEMRKYNLNEKDDEILASLFGVSKEVMGYRLKACLR